MNVLRFRFRTKIIVRRYFMKNGQNDNGGDVVLYQRLSRLSYFEGKLDVFLCVFFV